MTLRTKRSAPRDDNDDIENVEPSSSSNNKRLRINDSGTREPLQPLQVQPPSPRPPSPEQILLSKQRSDPSYWTNHRAIKMNALYGNRFLGKRIRASMRPFIERYECSEQNVYRFFYPNGRRSVPFACNYAHRAHGGQLLAVADEDRRVTLIRTDRDNTSVNEQYHESFYTHTNAVMDVKWSRDDEVLLTGSADQKIRLWDVESKTCIATLTGHSSTIRSVNFHPNHPSLIVAASREGAFRIYDMRSNTLNKRDSSPFSRGAEMYGPTKSCHNAHIETKGKKKLSSNERSVTCALFLPNEDNKVVTSGSYDGLIKIWDCRAGRDPRPLQISDFSPSGRPRGIADLKLDHAGVRLFSLRMDQTISMFNVSDITNPVSVFKDENFKTNSFFVKMAVSPDDRCIVSGSSANCVNIWDINRPHDEAVIFPGARGEVSSVAWQHDQIAACSDDGAVRIWKYNHH